MLLIHQTDGFVYKLTHIYAFFLEYKKKQSYRKYKLTLQPVNILSHLFKLDETFISIVVVNKKFQI